MQGEEDWRQVEQVETLLKTLYLLSGPELDIYIITNQDNIYQQILQAVEAWNSDNKLRLDILTTLHCTGGLSYEFLLINVYFDD